MNILILIFICLIDLSFENCQICLEGQTYVWGVDDDYKIIPETVTTCWGILDCNNALCSINNIPGTGGVLIKPSNNTNNFVQHKNLNIFGTCTEAHQIIVSGVDSNFHMFGNPIMCKGLLSCNEAICTINEMQNVSYVIVIILPSQSK